MENDAQERDETFGAGMEPRSCASVRTYCAPGHTVVELSGDIDMAVAGSVVSHLDAATVAGRPQVVVDLRKVTFIDCSSLGLLCRARRRALERGGHLALICVDSQLLRVLHLVGLLSVFVILSTLQDPSPIVPRLSHPGLSGSTALRHGPPSP